MNITAFLLLSQKLSDNVCHHENAVKWTILDKIGGEIVNLEHRFSGLCLFLLPKVLPI